MQKVSVETSQNVQIDYQLASLGHRILATLIDWLIYLGYGFLAFLILAAVGFTLPEFVYVILYLPIFFYHLTCEVFFDGQSIGKRQMNIKVIKLDGSQPTLGSYLFRWIIAPIDMIFYGGVAILTILINNKGQRLGDLAGGTTVVSLKSRVKLSDQRNLAEIEEDYQASYPEVINLNDKDISIIRESLKVYRQTSNSRPVLLISDKTKELLKIKSDLPAVKFLHTVLKDYSFLTAQV